MDEFFKALRVFFMDEKNKKLLAGTEGVRIGKVLIALQSKERNTVNLSAAHADMVEVMTELHKSAGLTLPEWVK